MSELYTNTVCLAPMVRMGRLMRYVVSFVLQGTLPLRLLSLRYGADLVYGEEIVDKRIIMTTRVSNGIKLLDTVDYVSNSSGSVVFRTCDEEKRRVVFQIGTADPILALQAAERVASDVASIDINMGCPKHFSVHGGMGAGLLRKPELACDARDQLLSYGRSLAGISLFIMKTLRRNLNIPVSCKIRLLHDTQATIGIAKSLEQAGADAIGVHTRQVHERPADSAHWEALAPVVSSLSVPVLANGDIFVRDDIDKVRELSGASSVLIARGALNNPSIFREQGLLPSTEVVVDYLKICAETENLYQNTKYTLSRMLPTKCDPRGVQTATVADLYATKDDPEMFALWDLQQFYKDTKERFLAKAGACNLSSYTASTNALASSGLGGDPKYDDAHVATQQFYCNTCHVQLASDKEVALHTKGKKHKFRLRNRFAVAESSVMSDQLATLSIGISQG
ncbi:Trna-dihydrouridine synthase, partial [Globisporangium splendens]